MRPLDNNTIFGESKADVTPWLKQAQRQAESHSRFLQNHKSRCCKTALKAKLAQAKGL